MGCGAGAQARVPPEEEPEEVSDASTGSTWATKTDISEARDAQLFAASTKGNSFASSKQDQAIMLLDAEDDEEDEIEIIYDPRKPKAHRQDAFANGQEPPEALEPVVRQPDPKPLSKQQQEEAAKLAERRKRFDNERYKNGGNSEQRDKNNGSNGGYPAPFDPPRVVSQGWVSESPTKGEPRPNAKNDRKSTDMMLGLNVTEAADSHYKDPMSPMNGGCLPGGIFDDDDVKFTPQTKNKHSGQHKMHQKHQYDNDRSPTGFDADDEKLMKEILDNFDDI